jgi:hypothetical protein
MEIGAYWVQGSEPMSEGMRVEGGICYGIRMEGGMKRKTLRERAIAYADKHGEMMLRDEFGKLRLNGIWEAHKLGYIAGFSAALRSKP